MKNWFYMGFLENILEKKSLKVKSNLALPFALQFISLTQLKLCVCYAVGLLICMSGCVPMLCVCVGKKLLYKAT